MEKSSYTKCWILQSLLIILIYLRESEAEFKCGTSTQTSYGSCDFTNGSCNYTYTGGLMHRTGALSARGFFSTNILIPKGHSQGGYAACGSSGTCKGQLVSPKIKPGNYSLSFWYYASLNQATFTFDLKTITQRANGTVWTIGQNCIAKNWTKVNLDLEMNSEFQIVFTMSLPTLYGVSVDDIVLECISPSTTPSNSRTRTTLSDIKNSETRVVDGNGSCSFSSFTDTCGYSVQPKWTVHQGNFTYPRFHVFIDESPSNDGYFLLFNSINDTIGNNLVTSPLVVKGTYCLQFWYKTIGSRTNMTIDLVSDGKSINVGDVHGTAFKWTQAKQKIVSQRPFQIVFNSHIGLRPFVWIGLDNIILQPIQNNTVSSSTSTTTSATESTRISTTTSTTTKTTTTPTTTPIAATTRTTPAITITTTKPMTTAPTTASTLPTRDSDAIKAFPTLTTTSIVSSRDRNLSCYNCDDLGHAGLCDIVKHCHHDEVCYIKRHVKYGRPLFQAGCMQTDRCKDEMTAYQSLPDRCVECCTGNYCNSKGCGDTGLSPQNHRGPLCFDCPYEQSPSDCNKLTICEQHEVCSIEEFRWGDYSHFVMGCSDDPCVHRRKRALHRETRSVPICRSCCTEDYCNSNCTQTDFPASLIG